MALFYHILKDIKKILALYFFIMINERLICKKNNEIKLELLEKIKK